MKTIKILFIITVLISFQKSWSDENDTIYVIGSKEKAFLAPGSANFIDQNEIKKQDHTDIGRILDKVPGVYIQEEDGLGLRPNIGLRGAHPHRSKKVTLLEDGILIGPSPYSSPAAYYFPTPTLAHNLEVYKGPSAVKYGPNSIGGAINLVTRPIAEQTTTELDLSVGTIQKAKLIHSQNLVNNGYLVELHRYQTKGFKEIPSLKGKSEGVEKNDVLLKHETDIGKLWGGIDQKITLKGLYNTEKSFETYLGVTNDDFKLRPLERYSASQDDLMRWNHSQAQIFHEIRLNENYKLNSQIYHHRFHRNWNRFSGLSDGRDLRLILSENADPDLINLLKGNRNTQNSDEQIVIVGNDRRYLSEGIQSQLKISHDLSDIVTNDLSIGVRLHRDWVKRNHSEIKANMINNKLSYLDSSKKITNLIHDEALATTLFINNDLNWKATLFNIGARLENVKNTSASLNNPEGQKAGTETVLIPGIGVNHSINDHWVILGGINRGVTLNGPADLSANGFGSYREESINYEVGVRYLSPDYSFETIGFYSDYNNIKGTCSFSSGCSADKLDLNFDGGKAEIIGLEAQVGAKPTWKSLVFPLSMNYTRTVSRFSAFNVSSNEEWGIGALKKGDPLPYIPQDTINVKTGL